MRRWDIFLDQVKPDTWLKISYGRYENSTKVLKYIGKIPWPMDCRYYMDTYTLQPIVWYKMLEPKSNTFFNLVHLYEYVGLTNAEIMTNEEVVQYFLEA